MDLSYTADEEAFRARVFAHYGPANAVDGTLRAIEWVRGRR